MGIGLVGVGMVADAHARAIRDLEGTIDLRGVFSRRPEPRTAFAQKHGVPAVESLEALIADPALDALIVVTPPNARQEIVEAAARSGKHLLLEKPIERDSAAAEAIVETCEAAGITLGIVLQHRMRETSLKLKALIEDGSLGTLDSVQVSVPWWRPQAYYDEPGRGSYARDGGGVLISQAIHTLDLMLWLTGPVESVQAIAGTTAHRMEAEDFVAGGLRFGNGALGSVLATTAAYPGGAESITLNFSACSARLEGGVLDLYHRNGETERFGENSGTGGGADPMAFPHDWHRAIIADFAEAIRTGRPPAIPGRDALAVHRLIDAIVRSSREGVAISPAP
ncbi:Gfo/Idh/MocA family oxidoreductase [Arsenicitalea aurantiaca]|uniref:Gfo/Idh/MocA family oxidoreductase n=1 Tax=Arsenicitalea aurantiaca TaxID=1783274 RepID=A0A433XBN2_9HYPH|nr:Gfo/Idh/MocA family oxidoreductase [Arsenicitalea aurantiaca]